MKKLICMIPTGGKTEKQIYDDVVKVLREKGYLKPKEEKEDKKPRGSSRAA